MSILRISRFLRYDHFHHLAMRLCFSVFKSEKSSGSGGQVVLFSFPFSPTKDADTSSRDGVASFPFTTFPAPANLLVPIFPSAQFRVTITALSGIRHIDFFSISFYISARFVLGPYLVLSINIGGGLKDFSGHWSRLSCLFVFLFSLAVPPLPRLRLAPPWTVPTGQPGQNRKKRRDRSGSTFFSIETKLPMFGPLVAKGVLFWPGLGIWVARLTI